ncbi:MAG: hypothetical protein ACRD5R_14725 [Candidatus Acidiferrales bacterium]
MAGARKKAVREGAGLVWRRQRVLWLIFFVSLFFAFLATRGMVGHAGEALNHSLEATPRLVQGFDISAIVELSTQPENYLSSGHVAFGGFPLVFAVFMLFVTGGVLAVYERDQTLSFGPFFEACGEHFWRFVRLAIYFAIVLIPIALLAAGAHAWHAHIDEVSISPFTSIHFFMAAGLVLVFLLMCARLWFDMAQVIAVAEDERRMHVALRRAARLLCGNFGSLFWLFLSIEIAAWIVFAIGLHVWMSHLPPQATTAAFWLGQFLILFWIATRLWQRASETAWYRKYLAENTARPTGLPASGIAAAAPTMPGAAQQS